MRKSGLIMKKMSNSIFGIMSVRRSFITNMRITMKNSMKLCSTKRRKLYGFRLTRTDVKTSIDCRVMRLNLSIRNMVLMFLHKIG